MANDLQLTDDPSVLRDKHDHYYINRVCKSCGTSIWVRKERENAGYCSRSCFGKSERGENGNNWKGDDAGYLARHNRVYRIRGNADYCIHRASGHCTNERYEWAQIHGTSGLSPYDYVSMCASCHRIYDGNGSAPRPGGQGSKNHNAKLNEDIVREIRSRPVSRGSFEAWAKEFNTERMTIRRAVIGETYKHVPMPEGIQL